MTRSDVLRAGLAEACAEACRDALGRGDGAGAERLLEPWRPLLDAEPRWAEARARAAALQGRDRDALAVLRRALTAHPDDRDCWVECARTLLRCGDATGAETAWLTVARLDAASAAPWCEIATLRLLRGDVAASTHAWSEALRREPGHAASARALRACLDPAAAARLLAASPSGSEPSGGGAVAAPTPPKV